MSLKRFEEMGAREIGHDLLSGEFHVQFRPDISGRYRVGRSRSEEYTLELGPIIVNMASGERVTAWVAGPCILDPAEVRKVITTMTGEQIRAAIYAEGYIRIGGDGDFRFTNVNIENAQAPAPTPRLGERWAFELEPPRGGHRQVIVRCGQPESRGFAGQILVSEAEAEDFALAMESLGAVVRRRV